MCTPLLENIQQWQRKQNRKVDSWKGEHQNFFRGTWIHLLIWVFNQTSLYSDVNKCIFQPPTYNDNFQTKYSQLFQFAQGKIYLPLMLHFFPLSDFFLGLVSCFFRSASLDTWFRILRLVSHFSRKHQPPLRAFHRAHASASFSISCTSRLLHRDPWGLLSCF